MPQIEGTLLSAGCAGLWYFDWIRQCTGHTGRHIGIEYYTPKPDKLPPNVEWIANTVGNMEAVGNASCDLVFSGENLEHLWPEEVIGFFEESNRVLRPGGWLVVDSPNRLITSSLNWSHPEHTIELTPTEAVRLVELAGFEIATLKGVWLCRDPRTGRLLSFDPNRGDSDWSLVERVAAAESEVDHSFIWWLTARKINTADSERLASEMTSIFERAWPERKERFLSLVGKSMTVNGSEVIRCGKGEQGPMIYGPYMPLMKGNYSASFDIVALDAESSEDSVVRCDVLGHGGREIVARSYSRKMLTELNGRVELDFALSSLEFGVQARCISLGNAPVQCRRTAEIKERCDGDAIDGDISR